MDGNDFVHQLTESVDLLVGQHRELLVLKEELGGSVCQYQVVDQSHLAMKDGDNENHY